MVLDEYESMKALHQANPPFAAMPIGLGTLESDPNLHFLLQEFLELDPKLPERVRFTLALATTHDQSRSPTGKFGFHVTTFNGHLSQNNDWCDTWAEFYAQQMRGMLDHERRARGPNEEIDALAPLILDRVIPRLLGSLSTSVSYNEPVLVHGDLWDGNTATNKKTGEPVVFDGACFYGHREVSV